MIKLIIFAIPAFFIYLFVNEYMKQKNQAEENWNQQWEQKKRNFEQEKALREKEKEIQKLKSKLEAREANKPCLLYTSPSPRDATLSRMPSSA